MNRPFVQQLRIQNYGCIKDVALELTPLHALIGPNDSGKSTILMALRTLTTLAAGPLGAAEDGGRLLGAMQASSSLRIEGVAGDRVYAVGWTHPNFYDEVGVARAGQNRAQRNYGQYSAFQHSKPPQIPSALVGSILLRLEPDELRKQTSLIPEGQPLRLRNALGLGLPAVYDAIVTRDLTAYVNINNRLATLFPTVKSLSLTNPSATEKAIGIQLHDGTRVSADFMSEGMLYFLAYAALPHLAPAAVILVEEPENGLHPARIREVMQVLREISKTTQVLLATHSPLVINELQPDEVSIVTRTAAEGTKAVRLKDTPNFAERSKVYALGELWVSYADGNLEAPLFKQPDQPDEPGEPVEWNESDER